MCDYNDNSKPVTDITLDPSTVQTNALPVPQVPAFEVDHNTLAAQITACVAATYNNGQICVKFPVIPNPICFSVHLPIPSGSAVKVCMSTCGFKISPPFFKGIKATVYVNNTALWTGVIWGSC